MYLGDDSPSNIIRCGRVKVKLKDVSISTLLGLLHIPNVARILISVKKIYVEGAKTVCGDGHCKMVQGLTVLMRGFWYGTLYKLLGRTIIDECSNSVVIEEGGKYDS